MPRNYRLLLQILFLSHVSFLAVGQEVVANDGDFSSSAQGSLSWTLGEVITETASTASGTFTQGFQQNYEDFLGIQSVPQNMDLRVYPNPFLDELFITSQDLNASTQIEIHDISGRLLYREEIHFGSGLHTQKIKLTNYLPGTYFLQIQPRGLEQTLTFPIIKSF